MDNWKSIDNEFTRNPEVEIKYRQSDYQPLNRVGISAEQAMENIRDFGGLLDERMSKMKDGSVPDFSEIINDLAYQQNSI